jgi:hypothetical protein
MMARFLFAGMAILICGCTSAPETYVSANEFWYGKEGESASPSITLCVKIDSDSRQIMHLGASAVSGQYPISAEVPSKKSGDAYVAEFDDGYGNL